MIRIYTSNEIEKIRIADQIVAGALDLVEGRVQAGVSLLDLDQIAETYILSKGGKPAFKGYHEFPATICASVNEQVVHGIPSGRKLIDGDIVGIDIGANYNGYFGDAARTLSVGEISNDLKQLLAVTKQSLFAGIGKAKSGNRLGDISHAIQTVLETNGFSVVRDYVGHGIGLELHAEPQIPNYGTPNTGPILKPGMVFAIEPMANLGSHNVKTLADGWTVVTADGSNSAHFEHSIVITENEPEILSIAA